jgi:hypothetical protein
MQLGIDVESLNPNHWQAALSEKTITLFSCSRIKAHIYGIIAVASILSTGFNGLDSLIVTCS